jgi:hypothetical protein
MKYLNVKFLRDVEMELSLSQDPEIIRYLVLLRDPLNSKITYSININGGELILGLNDDRRINSIELNYPRRSWTLIDDIYLRSDINNRGCLEFININLRHNELELPLAVQSDALYSSIKIDLGIKKMNSFWVALSSQCCVNIIDNCLSGIWIDIHSINAKPH